jgi:endonuclease/exonuclease/phosphatase family metal-dependent hydrolase
MKIIRKLLYFILVLVLLFGIFLFYSTLTDFKPAPEELVFKANNPDVINDSLVLDIMIWNIGYAGLSKEMDFFYDGGKNVRPPRDQVEKNVQAILQEIQCHDSMSFILLQEVDFHSKRSYRLNEGDSIMNRMKNFQLYTGMNYDVTFVPLPPKAPMGHVESGISSMMKYTPASVTRYAFPVNFAWPMKLFMLDRCFLVSRFPLVSGKELLIINTHNSAYDNGVLSTKELEFLSHYAKVEYEKGNYVIVGGDWNQSPPDFVPEFAYNKFDTIDLIHINGELFPEGWKWAYDATTPSNRRVDFPYDPASTRTTVIDMFLISPNVEPIRVKTLDLGFTNSDHQPVTARFRLRR